MHVCLLHTPPTQTRSPDRIPLRAPRQANNQWELDDAISDDPGKTSFHRALKLSQGTLAVLDKAGTIFTRIWCCYEAHVSLVTSKPVSAAAEFEAAWRLSLKYTRET